MTTATIRTMKGEDRHSVIALLRDSEPWTRLAYTQADWEQYFCPLPQGRESFVTEQNGRIIGIAVLRQKFLLGDYLELLGIGTDVRRAGTGKMLLAHVESLVFARTNNLFACVSDFNHPARAFYARQGYEEIGPLPDLIIQGSAEILLRKSTGPVRSSVGTPLLTEGRGERLNVKKLLHTRMRVSNLDETIGFYTTVLGLEVVERKTSPRGSQLAFLKVPNSDELIELTSFPPSGPVKVQEDLVHLAFQVESLEQTIAALTSQGVKITDGPTKTSSGSRFIFIDAPDGYEVELIERPAGVKIV